MMPRGRGRARLRVDAPQFAPAVVQPPGLQGAWARRPGPSAQVQPPAEPGPSRPRPQDGRPPVPANIVSREPEGVRRDEAFAPRRDLGVVGRGNSRRIPANESSESNPGAVQRPKKQVSKQGLNGSKIILQANYFKLRTTNWSLYKYRVDFAPEEDRTFVRKGLLRPHRETLGPYIFDGTLMYTSNRQPKKMELFSLRQSDDKQIRIEIKEVGDLVSGDPDCIQFFNIIMRKCFGHLNLQLVGRNYYDALNKIKILNHKLELWPGYLTSIRQHEQNILMCSEISHKVMRQQTLYDILDDTRKNCRQNPMQEFARLVIGQVVLTGYNNNTYRIDDVDFEVTPQSTFQLRNGESISYIDYYRNKYQINIRYNRQPMLVTKTKPRERRAGQTEIVYLVPELCRSTGLTDDMRAQWPLMKALAEHMKVSPESRIQKLLAFNRRLRNEPNVMADLKEWNMNLDSALVEFDGRVLDEENIIFAREKTVSAGSDADWTRHLRTVNMLSCARLDSWALIVTNRMRREANDFLSILIKVSSSLGFQIPQPRIEEIDDDRSQSYLKAIENIMSRMQVKLIFCIVPNNRPERYSAIKKKCCVDRPVPTQVFLAKNLRNKGLASIATKVAIQMNCKIGGAPWAVQILMSGLMVAGFDVCHDTVSKGHDFGALVASLDKSFGRYFSAVSEHTNGEELSNDLATNMVKALIAYKAMNGALPEIIIFYRDGVGEGQIPYVITHEVENLKRRLQKVYGTREVKLVFIIVTKRINTRLFFKGRNPPPGTVVDNVITDPSKYDFFIVPQSVRQGSVSPTYFNVISDTAGYSPDTIQKLSYKLTHMYYNWSGTVRVPAPCQYAHKLAFQVSQSIHRLPDSALENLLYFL